MMTERIKRNIAKMIDQGAPETDIDAYLKTENVTAESLRSGSGVPAEQVNAPVEQQVGIPEPIQPDLTEGRREPGLMQDFLDFRERGGLAGELGMAPALEQSPKETAIGFAGPGAIRSVGGAARQGLSLLRKPTPKAPTFEKLKELSGEVYDIADQSGVVVSNQSFGRSVESLGKKLTEAGIDPTLHPKATAAFKRLADGVAEDLPLRQFETLRRVAKGAASSIDRDEQRIARIITDHLDDYLGGIGKSDVVAGDPVVASKALTKARALWSRAKKGEEVEELIERANERAAQFSGSGLENAIRTEFRQLALNAKKMRRFTKAEQAAIRQVGRGGPTVNALRMLGKFAPTGVVSSVLSGGAGAAVGGAAGAVALPAAGLAARQGATALTQRNARLASELMRRGIPEAPPTRAPQSPGLGLPFGVVPGEEGDSQDALVRALLLGQQESRVR